MEAQYLENLSTTIRSPRDFWASYHKLSPKNQWISTDLKYNSFTASTSANKANLLQFFNSCFTSPTTPPSTNFLQSLVNNSGPVLSNVSCSQSEVLELLSSYKLKTASGPDGVSSRMLHETARTISPVLTDLFNLSLKQAKVPDSWKISNVTPIFKSGDPSSVANYRPISLLPLTSKILERIIHCRLMKFLLSNHLLSSCQYGFRPRSSTQEALLSVTNDWHLMLSKNHQVASIFFDVKKAFDSAPHDKLILSLARTGISGPLLQWFLDYLTNRQQ